MTERLTFGQAGACLHCMVWGLINEHSPEWPGEPDKKQYHAEYIVGNLVDVMAEVIAAYPRPVRRQFISQVTQRLSAKVAENIETRNAPQIKSVTIQ